MIFSQLEYIVALARERHFGRAAASCLVSQPALSEGIRKLEVELDVPLIRRGNTFEGLTAEGEQIVIWARRILADRTAMTEQIREMRSGVTGQLRIGSIPTASSAVSFLTAPFCEAHPLARVHVASDLRSDDVLRLLADYEVDGGITYVEDRLPEGFRVTPLFFEKYVLLTAGEGGFAAGATATWSDAAAMPLCLLDRSMQGRRLVDEAFRDIGLRAAPRLETDSVASLLAQMKAGLWATIVPAAWLHVFALPPGVRAFPLVQPERRVRVGLMTLSRGPETVLARAVTAVARGTDLTFLEQLPSEQV
ncbi:LysR family transcriptional regulator [Paenarthrobacter sp. DKR-5]|uniref:LysR family transcriptional regulator n=1 Tax=Paenarthrobacter sp. DKR-5 TaxID=2835535 RepID=UPI001BDD8BE3|nr:LysR family transcriptional regulator [Paenarthrobacter sp. DKR-5]MBT1003881.1 LysR family transcriptional regulator [Paenarthrobacter sp. DKR-5]